MPAYDIIESYGNIARVRYKGIGTEGFRDVIEEKVVNPTFRSTGIVEDTYDPDRGPEIEWGIEVWIVTNMPKIERREVISMLNAAARVARQEMPFMDFNSGEARVQTNQPLVPAERTHDWKGVVRAKGNRYRVDFSGGSLR